MFTFLRNFGEKSNICANFPKFRKVLIRVCWLIWGKFTLLKSIDQGLLVDLGNALFLEKSFPNLTHKKILIRICWFTWKIGTPCSSSSSSPPFPLSHLKLNITLFFNLIFPISLRYGIFRSFFYLDFKFNPRQMPLRVAPSPHNFNWF